MNSEITLARCIGFGGSSGGAASTNGLSSAVAVTSMDANVVAYTAGSTVVLMDVMSKQQLSFYRDESPSLPLGCLAFGGGTDISSSMPMHLAAGEQGGAAASQVLVWSVSSGQVIARLKQHKHGISSVCFSPDGKQLLSAGSSYDGQVCLWDYQKGVLLARASAQAEIMAATFAADGSIASAGKEHLKVWGMTGGGVGKKLGAPGSITLTPRAFNLKDLRSQTFVDVKSKDKNSMYALTASGVLMYIHEAGSRTVDKTVNVQVAAAHSLAVSPHLVACTCSAGTVRLFATHTLAFRANLPRPSPTHSAAQHTTGPVATGLQRGGSFSGANGGIGGDCFPDAVRASFDASGTQLSVAYADRSLLIWDVQDLKKITRIRCLLSHSAAIWGAEMLPHTAAVNMGLVSDAPSLNPAQPGTDSQAIHESAIVTCSADGTIRLWSLTHDDSSSTSVHDSVPSVSAAAGSCPAKLTHARTLRGVVYPSAAEQEGREGVLADGKPAAHGMYSPELAMHISGPGSASRHTAPTSLRCLKVSPDCSHLAIGDAQGNVRIYSLATLTLLAFKVAHEGEVLSLDYGAGFLASGGRDSVIHIYSAANKYALVNTLEDHSASVTAVRFSPCGQRLISAGADKVITFRSITDAKDCSVHTYCTHVVAPHSGSGAASAMGAALSALGGRRGGTKKGLVYDLTLDSTGTWAVAAVQGSTLLVFDVSTGKQVKQLKTGAEVVRVALDGHGSAAYCGCADGSLAVYALSLMGANPDEGVAGVWGAKKREKGQWDGGVGGSTGSKAGGGGGSDALLAQVAGHAEVLTAVVVLGDARKGVVTVGGDGCILHWHLPAHGADAAGNGAMVSTQSVSAGLQTSETRQLATAGEAMQQPAGAGAQQAGPQEPWAAPRAGTPTRAATPTRVKPSLQPSTNAASKWGAGAAEEGARGGVGTDRAPGKSPLRGGAARTAGASPLRGAGGSNGRLAAGMSPMRGGGRLAAGAASPMRDGRRAAAVSGGDGTCGGVRGARCGGTASAATVNTAAVNAAMVDVEAMGEPLQSIDKLPSWAAGSLSPARGGRMAQAVNAAAAEEDLVPSLSRFADAPQPTTHHPAMAPLPQPTGKQQRQQWQVEDPHEGVPPSAGNNSGVRKWAADLEEADDMVLLSAGSGEGSASFKVCEKEGAGAEVDDDDCQGVVDQAPLSGAASTAAADGTKGTPPAGGHVARDLFRAHFGDLDQSSTSASPALQGREPHMPHKDERRQSLTTLYRTMASQVQASGSHKETEATAFVKPDQQPQSSVKTAAHPKQPVTPEKELKVGRDIAEGAAGATSAYRLHRTPQRTTAKGQAGQGQTSAAAMEVDGQVEPEMSLARHTQDALGAKRSASRGRSGKMAGELSKMRDRLLSLQQTYTEQQARQTPWRQQQREQRQEQRQARSPSPCARGAHAQQQVGLKQQVEPRQCGVPKSSAPSHTPMAHPHKASQPPSSGKGNASGVSANATQEKLSAPGLGLQRLSSANKGRQQQQQQLQEQGGQPSPSLPPLAHRSDSSAPELPPAAQTAAPPTAVVTGGAGIAASPAAAAAAATAPSEPSAPTASGVTEVSFGVGLGPADCVLPDTQHQQQQQQQDQLSKASPDCVTSGPSALASATPVCGVSAAHACGGVAATPTKPATPPKVPLSASTTPTKDSGTPTPLPTSSATASKPPMSSPPSSQKSSLLSKLKRAFSLKSSSPSKEAPPPDQQQQQQQQQHGSFSSLWGRTSSSKKKRDSCSGSAANSCSKDTSATPQASPAKVEGGQNEGGSTAGAPSHQTAATSAFKTAAAALAEAAPPTVHGSECGSASKASHQEVDTSAFKTTTAALTEAAPPTSEHVLPSPQASFNFATGLAGATKLGVDGLSAEAAPAGVTEEGLRACQAGQASSDRFDSLAAWAAPSLLPPQLATNDTPRSITGVPQDTAWLPLSPDPEVRQSCDRDAPGRQAIAGGELSLRQSAAKGNVNAHALTSKQGPLQDLERNLKGLQLHEEPKQNPTMEGNPSAHAPTDAKDIEQDWKVEGHPNAPALTNARESQQDWKAKAAARGYKLEDSWARHSGDGSGWSADASQSGSKGMVVGRTDAGQQSVNCPTFQRASKLPPKEHRYGSSNHDGAEGISPHAAHSEEGKGSTGGTASAFAGAEDEVCSRPRVHPAVTCNMAHHHHQLEGRPVKEQVAAFEEAMQAARQQRLASTPLKQQQQQQQLLGNLSPWRGTQQQQQKQHKQLPLDTLEGALASLELSTQHVERHIASAGEISRDGLQQQQQQHKAVIVRVVGQLQALLQNKQSSSSSCSIGGADQGGPDVVPASGHMQDQKESRQTHPNAMAGAGCISQGTGLGEQLKAMDRNFDFKFERIQQERHMEHVMQGIN